MATDFPNPPASLEAQALVQWATDTFGDALTLACSAAVEDSVLVHLAAQTGRSVRVFMLDTGRLHPETHETFEQLHLRYPKLRFEVYAPDGAEVEALVKAQGGLFGFREGLDQRHACCEIRKVKPLRRALEGSRAWLTGLRREQSPTRTNLQPTESDGGSPERLKIAPLLDWDLQRIWAFAKEHHIPTHPLHDAGFPSIGCAPCTRAILPGEELRAGRWWWEQPEHKECGLHNRPDTTPAAKQTRTMTQALTHLEALESEAIHILREVAGQCQNPALLFSGGKDSLVLLRLAEKAFRPGRFPFPLMHIDTGHNYAEVIAFRDHRAAELGERLIVRTLDDSIAKGRIVLRNAHESRNRHQSVTLLDAVAEFKFDCLIGGARRDEEKARAKERIFSFRDEFGQWDPKNQRPELWNLYNARIHPGEHIRAFPISNWTELDVWQYIAEEGLELPSIYFAHERDVVVLPGGALLPVTPLTPVPEGSASVRMSVRFRTVGDISCTAPVPSVADTLAAIVKETATAEITERGATRLDDQTSEASMEQRKKEGYF